MLFPGLNGYYSGVAVPVASLRGDTDSGIGEFADLPELGTLCSETGLTVLQILPVNDTGFDSSPYSAISAYALHPVYIRLGALPELSDERAARVADKHITGLTNAAEGRTRIAYHEVLSGKLAALRAVYDTVRETIDADRSLDRWIEENDWVRPYAVFRMMKDTHEQAAWWQWERLSEPDTNDIETCWADPENRATLRFYAWVQQRLEEQLAAASEKLSEYGVYLKGDLPILMNDDSADVWLHRDIFRRELRAGAPPDMFSRFGQNWGFPVYNWETLAAQDYRWWRGRLRQAAKFFHMFRIDHVLGFFRIWAVPAENETGTMGFFSPARQLSRDDLHRSGFADDRIRWLSEPHMTGERIEEVLGEHTESLLDRVFDRLGDEDLYTFSDAVSGERWLKQLPIEDERIIGLIDLYGDRVLVRTDDEHFAPAWSMNECSRYPSLEDEEKRALEELVAACAAENETIWTENGRSLLGFMREEVSMLPCAEDLGVVPDCVPEVLADLGILGLRVPRWAREWDEDDSPFIPPAQYPYLTVCAASVHDTSTLRGWWYEEPDARRAFWNTLGLEGDAPDSYHREVAQSVLNALSGTRSAIAMYEIQDLFALTDDLVPDDPNDERINTPGTYNLVNWSYRVPHRTGALRTHRLLCDAIREVVANRRSE